MNKSLLTLTALILGASAVLSAQSSPPATANVTIGGSALSIRYSAPSVRGRKIFGDGGLLSRDPTFPAWRAGANDATTFRTNANLDLGGLAVPKGTYTLYVWVKDPNAWELIVSKQTGQWGDTYNPRLDLGRVKMTMAKPPALVEQLKYTLSDKGANKGELRLEWEQHIGLLPFTVK